VRVSYDAFGLWPLQAGNGVPTRAAELAWLLGLLDSRPAVPVDSETVIASYARCPTPLWPLHESLHDLRRK
jgi:hypothetical protein